MRIGKVYDNSISVNVIAYYICWYYYQRSYSLARGTKLR